MDLEKEGKKTYTLMQMAYFNGLPSFSLYNTTIGREGKA